ncbi:uncharacterized protein LOC135369299 [Ornithodoros turicata]|uniref:uncharacterized protein LOC135369299 n=1 Tax=Ornithodoros turicata TaxID=34597 RepID=UPI003138A203
MKLSMLQFLYFLICNLEPAFNGASAIDHVPVRESDPWSTMYAWRPINIFFIGDQHFRSLQRSVVMPSNITELYLYSQSILNALVFMYREDYPMCDIKLKCSGTYALTEHEQRKLGTYYNVRSEDFNNTVKSIQQIVNGNAAASAADIVIILLGSEPPYHHPGEDGGSYTWYNATGKMCSTHNLILFWDQPYAYARLDELRRGILKFMHPTGRLSDARSTCRDVQEFYRMALAQEQGLVCFNTPETCCVPSFFGMFNIRKEPFCEQELRVPGEYGDLKLDNCQTHCSDGRFVRDWESLHTWHRTPPGWVWNEAADYWKKSLLCPEPDDKICAGFGNEHTLDLTYKKFQRTLAYIWDLDDYELPDLDPVICRLQNK